MYVAKYCGEKDKIRVSCDGDNVCLWINQDALIRIDKECIVSNIGSFETLRAYLNGIREGIEKDSCPAESEKDDANTRSY